MWVPALKEIMSARIRLPETNTSIPYRCPNGGMAPQLAVGKHCLEFVLDGQGDGIGAGGFPQQVEIDLAVRRKNGHGHFTVQFDQHGLGEQAAGHTRLVGHILGGIGTRVLRHLEVDIVFGEVFEKFGTRHLGPPR